MLRSTYQIFEWDRNNSDRKFYNVVRYVNIPLVPWMQERSEATCHMAMPQCCYLAKGAKRPSHTTNTIKFDRIPFDPSNSIERFDLCPFDQKNSTYLQPPWNPLLQKAANLLIVVRTTEHFTETRDENFTALAWRTLYFQGHRLKIVSIVYYFAILLLGKRKLFTFCWQTSCFSKRIWIVRKCKTSQRSQYFCSQGFKMA